jgi:uncharacterized protein YecT (DUF1311 family)
MFYGKGDGCQDLFSLGQGKDDIFMKPLAFIMVIVAHTTFAQDSSQFHTCQEKAKTQMEMNVCASQEAAHADAQLNDIYKKLLSKVSGQPEAIAKIKAAEKAWITYRDAYMEAMYPAKDKQFEYGSIYPMEADLLFAKLTYRQVTALKELIEQHSGKGK